MPVPDNFKVNVPEKKEFELLPDDTYEVKISNIEFKPNEPVYQKPDEVEDQLNFEFTITEESKFKGRKLWKSTSTTMSAGSNGYSPSSLYKLFCAVNQITLNDEDAKSVGASSINDMLGKGLRLVVKTEPNRKGVKKNKIKDVLPLKAGNVVNKIDALQSTIGGTQDNEVNVEDIPF